MVLKLRKSPEIDPYLTKAVRTDRFDLVNCNPAEAAKITLPWASDREILHNLMFDQASYSKVEWVRKMGRPDGHRTFIHAIVARDIKGTIGAHKIRIDKSGTARTEIALTAKSWWGKGVFEEVRAALMDHFCRSPRVVRFAGRVLSTNASSLYNYKKLGFRLVGHEKKSWLSPVTGTHCDTLMFEFLAEEWRRKRQLELND